MQDFYLSRRFMRGKWFVDLFRSFGAGGDCLLQIRSWHEQRRCILEFGFRIRLGLWQKGPFINQVDRGTIEIVKSLWKYDKNVPWAKILKKTLKIEKLCPRGLWTSIKWIWVDCLSGPEHWNHHYCPHFHAIEWYLWKSSSFSCHQYHLHCHEIDCHAYN